MIERVTDLEALALKQKEFRQSDGQPPLSAYFDELSRSSIRETTSRGVRVYRAIVHHLIPRLVGSLGYVFSIPKSCARRLLLLLSILYATVLDHLSLKHLRGFRHDTSQIVIIILAWILSTLFNYLLGVIMKEEVDVELMLPSRYRQETRKIY